MAETLTKALHDFGRSVVGALLLGMPLLYTMETWWLGWRLPALVLLAYSLIGLALVTLVVRAVGFKPEEQHVKPDVKRLLFDFFELVSHVFVTSVGILFLVGIIDGRTPFHEVMRLSTLQIVPLGFGAAVANHLFRPVDEGQMEVPSLGEEAAAFALGAILFSLPVAPTEEMELMAAHATFIHLAAMVGATLLLMYVALYELEFRGRGGRVGPKPRKWLQWGDVAVGYVIALAVSTAALAGFGHFLGVSFPEAVQQVVVLSFLASLGGAAARVVI